MLSARFKLVPILFVLAGLSAHAGGAPKVGRAAAAKYFQQNPDASKTTRYVASDEPVSSDGRVLTFGASYYTGSDSYNWGNGHETDVGKAGVDMSYRLSTNNLLDDSLRIAYAEYSPAGGRATKMSFMYALTLPDAGSRFPLYFGVAAGPGVFFTQIPNESSLSLDYQLFLGLRLFNVFQNTGFYVEGGMKNHLQLTNDGQLNGTFISGGGIFTF